MYTLQSLKAFDPVYDAEHSMTEKDVAIVNQAVAVIEKTLDSKQPKDGDVVIYTNEYGKTYAWAHLEATNMYGSDYPLVICEEAYTPFVSVKDGSYSTSASGGAWTGLKKEEVNKLKFVRTGLKKFCIWGSSGMRANGAIDFMARVNVWEYTAEKEQ
jgi:hypothetical protein